MLCCGKGGVWGAGVEGPGWSPVISAITEPHPIRFGHKEKRRGKTQVSSADIKRDKTHRRIGLPAPPGRPQMAEGSTGGCESSESLYAPEDPIENHHSHFTTDIHPIHHYSNNITTQHYIIKYSNIKVHSYTSELI